MDHSMRECKTNYGMKMGSGRIREPTYRGNSGYSKRFQNKFKTTSRSTDNEESVEREDREHQSNFAQIDESIETSPCYFAEEWEIAESKERNGEIELEIIVDSGAARSTMSLKQ